MRKLNIKVNKYRNDWTVLIVNNGEHKGLYFPTREQAMGFKNFCEWVYKLGRLDEFKDNGDTAPKLREKFGI